jgi:chromosome segregation ATPase
MNEQIKPLKQQISALKAEIKQEESRVERQNASLVKLVSQGNNWAPSQLAAKKANATKLKRANLTKLEDAYNQALSGNSAALASINTQAIQSSQATIEENNTQKAAMSNLFQLFGVGSKIMTILFRMFLVVSFLSKNPNLDANGDGEVDGEDVTAAAYGAFR